VRLPLDQRLRTSPAISPAALQFGKRAGVPSLRLSGVARLQAALLLASSDERAQVRRHILTEPADTTVGMRPGTTTIANAIGTSLLYRVALSR
jgi:hypothetical protein